MKHNKRVEGDEYQRRLDIFTANAKTALHNAQLDPTAQHGLTQFADLTPEEFRGTFMGLNGGREEALRNPKMLRYSSWWTALLTLIRFLSNTDVGSLFLGSMVVSGD